MVGLYHRESRATQSEATVMPPSLNRVYGWLAFAVAELGDFL
jgi:hypothetical protein